jgi:hypothetical protein
MNVTADGSFVGGVIGAIKILLAQSDRRSPDRKNHNWNLFNLAR